MFLREVDCLSFEDVVAEVVDVGKGKDGLVWHTLAADATLPGAGTTITGEIDWERRYLLMRIHSAQHVLNGVIWNEYGAHVTGASMTPGEGHADCHSTSRRESRATQT